MSTAEIKALTEAHVINTYGVRKLAITRGEGAIVWDADGREYLDCFSGIAVCSLGHCHPRVTEAICAQARKLVHVSNLYYTEPQARLAEALSAASFAERWFFCNGGAEANEAAIKLARRYWHMQGAPRPGIIAAEGSFHGRTLTTISATGQPKYQEGFAPLTPGFTHVPFGDLAALRAAVTPETGAILLEPIQGEGGVRTAGTTYWQGVRKLCDAHGILLIFDEVQCGMGRTGNLFAYEGIGVRPDIITLAKALGNGVPIGAMGCTGRAAEGFAPGAHACTFGGNPLSCAAALATLEIMQSPGFLEQAREIGEHMLRSFNEIAVGCPRISEVRGQGLMIGVEFTEPVAPIVEKMIEGGVLCGPAGPNVLRFVPPLVLTREQADRAIALFRAAIGEDA